MRRLTAWVMLALAALARSAAAQPAFDGDAWVADLRQAQAALSAGYANFDWAVSERGMDLPRTLAAILRVLMAGRSRLAAPQAKAA